MASYSRSKKFIYGFNMGMEINKFVTWSFRRGKFKSGCRTFTKGVCHLSINKGVEFHKSKGWSQGNATTHSSWISSSYGLYRWNCKTQQLLQVLGIWRAWFKGIIVPWLAWEINSAGCAFMQWWTNSIWTNLLEENNEQLIHSLSPFILTFIILRQRALSCSRQYH